MTPTGASNPQSHINAQGLDLAVEEIADMGLLVEELDKEEDHDLGRTLGVVTRQPLDDGRSTPIRNPARSTPALSRRADDGSVASPRATVATSGSRG